MAEAGTTQKVTELIKGIKVAMLTYVDGEGHLVSKPMGTRDVDFDGDLWFLAERDSQKVQDIQANPHVNVAFAGKGTWVSVCGTAEIVDDNAKIAELWSGMAEGFMEGGPENPNNILIRVDADGAEYWDSPGGIASTAVAFAKAKVAGKPVEGDNAKVDLP